MRVRAPVRDGQLVASRDHVDPIAAVHDGTAQLPATLAGRSGVVPTFTVHARMTALPGRRDELADRGRDAARACGSGLLGYGISGDRGDPTTLLVTATWTDKATHDRVTTSEPVRAASTKLQPLLAAPPDGCYGDIIHQGRGAH
ncbi:hypothetical protein Athai_12940 [Actinocatenispora thailandica]|uniref:ABM domain-containing protein n=1 Tax=Actinocatenispora thailandica TaxID=227318 RepID=A0A7R7DLJ5_9ACTN|nr:antibiotic biosynthesis monooxygenase [Actinocatenispora thailandica]BCJ33791.1 hypothetical protein Athai_12940 [Actinocatenispora thailandica]